MHQDDQDGRLVIVDVKTEDEEEEEEDELEHGGQDTEECFIPRPFEDESQVKLVGKGWRKKTQLKMDHGKQWIVENLLFVTTTVSVVSLSSIKKAYCSDCHREGREPLTMFVLARLIHKEFPEAGKCRLGPRGHQKIHYNHLQMKLSSSPNQRHMNGVVSTTSGKEAAGETSSDNLTLKEVQTKGKKPASGVKPRDVEQDTSQQKSDGTLCATGEAVPTAATQLVSQDDNQSQQGCKDAANTLVQVVKSFKLQGKLDMLLKLFAHSASCSKPSCYPVCLMFRRIRHHVVSARHACHVMRIYTMLLRLHVARCNDDYCGMTACPALRASQRAKRSWDDDLQEEKAQLEQQHDEFQQTAKRVIVQAKRPFLLKLRLPSPASSLPNSEPSTPSPSVTPTHTLPPSPVRNTLPLSFEARCEVKIPTEHRGA